MEALGPHPATIRMVRRGPRIAPKGCMEEVIMDLWLVNHHSSLDVIQSRPYTSWPSSWLLRKCPLLVRTTAGSCNVIGFVQAEKPVFTMISIII